MRVLVKRLSASPHYGRALEWGKLVAITGSAQTLIQVMGLVSGILIIRLLPTEQYALYTMANAMLGTISVIADGGIATGVMARGGRVWQDKWQLGASIATGLDLRRKFAAVVLLVATPVLLWLLHRHSHNWLLSGLVVASLVPTFMAALSGTLLEIAPRLHQDVRSLQKIEVVTSVSRLLLTVALLLALPWSCVALLAAGLPQLVANRRLRVLSARYADWHQPPDPEVRREIVPIIRRTLPGAIYYCVSGQITIWLISLYGSTEAVAQIGALGRLTMVLNIFTVLFATLVVPRLARLVADRRQLLLRVGQIHLLVLLITVATTTVVYLFPNQALALLGKRYHNLTTEVVLMAANGCIGMAVGIAYSVNVARGWILPPVLNIGGSIALQIALLFMLDLSFTTNILWFSILSSIGMYLLMVAYFVWKAWRIPTLAIAA